MNRYDRPLCSKCGKKLPLSRKLKHPWGVLCDSCYVVTRIELANTPSLSKSSYEPWSSKDRLVPYKLGMEHLETLFLTQGGSCVICGEVLTDSKGWVIDHDHSTNVVRGLLCSSCNAIVGRMESSQLRYTSAFSYLGWSI